jgi:hypothetical protein
MSTIGLVLVTVLGLCVLWAAIYARQLYEELAMSKVLIVASNFPRAQFEASERNLPSREWAYGDPHSPERSMGLLIREVIFIDGWDRDINKTQAVDVKTYFNTLTRVQTGYQDS